MSSIKFGAAAVLSQWSRIFRFPWGRSVAATMGHFGSVPPLEVVEMQIDRSSLCVIQGSRLVPAYCRILALPLVSFSTIPWDTFCLSLPAPSYLLPCSQTHVLSRIGQHNSPLSPLPQWCREGGSHLCASLTLLCVVQECLTGFLWNFHTLFQPGWEFRILLC